MMLLRLMAQGVRDLARTPLTVATTVLSLTVVVFLGAAFVLVLVNLDRNLKAAQGEVVFQMYWRPDTQAELVFQHWSAIGEMPGVLSLETYTPQEALERLRTRFALEENLPLEAVLPYTAVVHARIPEADPRAWMEAMEARLLTLPGVEQVRSDPLRVDLAASWFAWSKRLLMPIAAVLLALVALASGVAVRATMAAKQDELEILMLVGASPLYIRIPLVVGAATQGLVASSLAMGLLYGVYRYLGTMLQGSILMVTFLPESIIGIGIGTVTIFAMLGSLFSFRHM